MKHFSCAILTLTFFVFTAPLFAGVNVSSPSSGESVSSPFSLSANSSSCSSQPTSAMGYSLDSSSETTMVHSTSIDAKVSASTGTHKLHVKAWGNAGAVCVTDVGITVSNVTNDASTNTSVVPSNAVNVSSIEALSNWKATHDSGASGYASGKTGLVGSPSRSGSARGFVTTFSSSGAERYSVHFGDNTSSTNFMYDGWVYLTSSSSHIGNIEMDVNQTMPNGQTVIFGIQCSGYSGTWEYTANLGTASHPKGHWVSSSAPCNPRKWSTYKWHHVQMTYSRNSTGYVTYKYVWLDGVRYTLNHTVFAARALGWANSLITNFQIDGVGSGTVTAYLDSLIIYRW
jgi:hypothetical protein